MSEVELHNAFFFTCPYCGTDTLVYGATLDESLSDAEKLELMESHGIPAYETGHWMSRPDSVQCKDCSYWFDVAPIDSDDSEIE